MPSGEAEECVAEMQVASEAADLDTYFCSALRLMPIANIDPSLAIGFYCSSSGAHTSHISR